MRDEKKPGGRGPSEDYEVGYGKPPLHTRFKPGRSGNPRGRPKGTKNLRADLQEELIERIVVREGEQSKRVSKQRAVVKSLVARTLKGDGRAATLLTSMMMRLLDTGERAPWVAEALDGDEREILEAFEERLRRGGASSADDDDGTSDESGKETS